MYKFTLGGRFGSGTYDSNLTNILARASSILYWVIKYLFFPNILCWLRYNDLSIFCNRQRMTRRSAWSNILSQNTSGYKSEVLGFTAAPFTGNVGVHSLGQSVVTKHYGRTQTILHISGGSLSLPLVTTAVCCLFKPLVKRYMSLCLCEVGVSICPIAL